MNGRPVHALLAIFISAAATVSAQVTPAPDAPDSSIQPAATQSVQEAPQTPSSPPQVTCKGNQLSIAAKGSTLASILNAVHACTGAKIDVPESAGMSRFFDTLGPGPVREVLTTLLDATDFNYVIGSSDSDPDKVETILLIARGSTPDSEPASDRALTPNRRAFEQMRRNFLTAGVPDETNAPAPESTAVSPAPAPDPPQATANDPTSLSQPAPSDQTPAQGVSSATPEPVRNAAPPPTGGTSQPSTQPSSVDDQIKSMEQLFQQRQQMIAGQSQNQQQHQ